MASLHGIPLLSGPPSTNDTSEACRKCNREFNILFTRSRKCNHCGYLYCHSCSDYQALLPRTGPERGYDPVHVCAYCIELLNITAAGTGQLRGVSLSKLKSYADAYNINISRAVEKADIVEAIVRAREQNGCLPQSKEDYYRQNKVPNPHAGSRPRGIFSRSSTSGNPPPVPPRPQAQTGHNFPRPDLNADDPPPPTPPRPQGAFPQPIPPRTGYQYPPHYNHPPPPPPPQPQQPYGHYTPPYQQYHPGYHTQQQHYNVPPYHPSFPQPQHTTQPPHPPPQETRPPPPPPPRPNTSSTYRQAAQSYSDSPPPPPPPPPPRQRTTSTPPRPPPPPSPAAAAPPPPPTPTIPLPTLDQLLVMTQASISGLPISVLKNILFTNHVNASMILEKSELVKKVMTLIDDERMERERQRLAEEAERLGEEDRRREREEAIQRQQEGNRREEERVRKERRERQRARVEEVEDGVDDMMDVEVEVSDGGEGDEDEVMGNVRGAAEPEGGGGANRPSTPVGLAPSPPPKVSPLPQKSSMASALERTGLCVICQDEEANIAIVDCGHLAMCRGCSELVMASSKECPLCRTRIVTEARLLRIFKT